MNSAVAIMTMNRYAHREHAGLLQEAKRPNLVRHYNAHPELVERLLERAEENRRHTFSMTDDVNV